MFETAELGRSVSKKAFEEAEATLRTDLLQAQRDARAAGLPVVLVVSGVEGAGKGDLVNQLSRWLDSRGMRVHVFWDATDEEQQRPWWWRFWRALPPRGEIGVLFGSWYTDPIVEHAYNRIDVRRFEAAMHQVKAFERMLTVDGALFVKVWLHLGKTAQQERWQADEASGRPWKVSPIAEEYGEHYDAFLRASERAIRLTDTGLAPWHIVDAEDSRFRDLTVGRTLLAAIRARLAEPVPASPAPPPSVELPGEPVTVLSRVDLDQQLSKSAYRHQLAHWQQQLNRLGWAAHRAQRSLVAVFEGWDAGGKGGAIRRLTDGLDPRLMQVISIAAPTDEEVAQHYLWRFWRHVPRDGRVTIYDRSWYGRVLVERVEGFATRAEWSRAYHEINAFEGQLMAHGTVVTKFWLHISPEEQLARFTEREKIPWKKHKITDEDWRNREQWPAYAQAVNDMVQHTSTSEAPWVLVPGNDKRFARVMVVRTLCERLAAALGEELEPLPEPPQRRQ